MPINPHVLAGVAAVSTVLTLSVGPPAPVPKTVDHDAFVLAAAMYEQHQIAVNYSAQHGGVTGVIPAATLATYLPATWVLPGGVTLKSCIGSAAEKGTVVTYVASTTYPYAPRVGAALANLSSVQAGDIGAAGLVQASGSIVPAVVTPVYTFPVATCGPLVAPPFPAIATPFLP